MTDQVKAIDLYIWPPSKDSGTKDSLIEQQWPGPGRTANVLYKGEASIRRRVMSPEELVAEMDEAGVDKGMLALRADDANKDWIMEAIEKFPGKFFVALRINPIEKGIMNEIRRVKSLVKECGLQAIRITPQHIGVPCTDYRVFPFYPLAIEYDLKVYINVGYSSPSGLARTQSPLFVDEVCFWFPEAKIIQSHTGLPWAEEVINNVIKHPNCYLATTTFRPKYFPPELVHHINTRAQDKVMWGTEYPLLSFKMSLDDIKQLPFLDHVRPKYLRENALRLFKFK